MEFANRIVGPCLIKASDLNAHESNWRIHPQSQITAMGKMLDTLGWVGRVIIRNRSIDKSGDPEWEIINGHMRAAIALRENPDQLVPCLEVDLSDHEAHQAILTFDSIGMGAEISTDNLEKILTGLESEPELSGMLEFLDETVFAEAELPDHVLNPVSVDPGFSSGIDLAQIDAATVPQIPIEMAESVMDMPKPVKSKSPTVPLVFRSGVGSGPAYRRGIDPAIYDRWCASIRIEAAKRGVSPAVLVVAALRIV